MSKPAIMFMFSVLQNGLLQYILYTLPKVVIAFVFDLLENGLLRYIYFTHTQSRDNLRVECATEWTVSVHTSHMPKAVIAFLFKVLLGTCSHFRRFRVFPFSRLRVFVGSQVQSSRFRVYSFSRFAGGVPAARTQISCAQQLSPLMRVAGLRGKYAVIYSVKESLNVPDLQTVLVDDNAEVLEECFEWLDIHRQISLRTNDSGVTWRPF